MEHLVPNAKMIEQYRRVALDHMYPNSRPEAVILEEALTPEECDEILQDMLKEDSYSFGSCGAKTIEAAQPLSDVFRPVVELVKQTNARYWQLYLDPIQNAWLQTYEDGAAYTLHDDTSPGQSRKMTAVVLLTPSKNYGGGFLKLYPYGLDADVPKSQGTVCIFPAWVPHEVTPVTKGVRYSLNLGFYGPPFR